jgi:hypothetical protein
VEVSAVIVASLLLIAIAVMLLIVGLVTGANALLVVSIVASLLATFTLIISGRHYAARRAAAAETDAEEAPTVGYPQETDELLEPPMPMTGRMGAGAWSAPGAGPSSRRRGGHPDPGLDDHAATAVAVAVGRTAPGADPVPGRDGYEPTDEPDPEPTSIGDSARVARMAAPVTVIDGRPRYHLGSCVHLLGRDGRAMAVREAVERGFTPCGLCEPDARLLGRHLPS